MFCQVNHNFPQFFGHMLELPINNFDSPVQPTGKWLRREPTTTTCTRSTAVRKASKHLRPRNRTWPRSTRSKVEAAKMGRGGMLIFVVSVFCSVSICFNRDGMMQIDKHIFGTWPTPSSHLLCRISTIGKQPFSCVGWGSGETQGNGLLLASADKKDS